MPTVGLQPAITIPARTRAVPSAGAIAPAMIALLALAACAWLGLGFTNLADWGIEARPSVDALLAGHLGAFLRLAPTYGGSLLLRAPLIELTRLWHGGGNVVYCASAVPCLAAAGALGIWLGRDLGRRTSGLLAQALAITLCVANPLAISALQQSHPEDLLGAVLCVAAVLCAQRDHAVWSGVLVGLATANKAWGVLAAGPVLVALQRDRRRALGAMLLSAGAVLAPFALVRAGGYVGQTEAVGLGTGSIFNPWQLWWFLGTPEAHGAGRAAPGWLGSIGHLLPIAVMAPLTLSFAVRRRDARRRPDALLLLALLLLLRCVLDPWDTVYYPVAFVSALLAWETTTHDRPPWVTLAAVFSSWWLFSGAHPLLGAAPDLLALAFTVVAVPSIGAICVRLLAPRRRSSPVPRAPMRST
jgi:hypothetical protein